MLTTIIKKREKEPGSRAVSRRMSILEGCTGRVVFNLTSGAFIVGFLEYMGISDGIIAKIAALPVLAASIQFISPIFFNHLPWKKTLITIANILHRLLLSFLFLVPLLPVSSNAKTLIIIVMYFVAYFLLNFVMPAFQAMTVSFARKSIRGRFFGVRESYLLSVGASVSLLLGRFLDHMIAIGQQFTAYMLIMSICLIASAINAFSLIKMYEVRTRPSEKKLTLKESLTTPLKNKKFRKIILIFVFWNASLQFGAAFFGVYQVSTLKLPYTTIMFNTILFTVANFIFSRIWGKLADATSWTNVSILTIGLLGIVHFSWLFVAGGGVFMYCLITALFIVGGIAWAGIGISLFNMPFDYIDSKSPLMFIGFNSALGGLVGYAFAFVGAEIVERFESFQFYIGSLPIGIIQCVLSFSGVLIFLTAVFMKVLLPEAKQAGRNSD